MKARHAAVVAGLTLGLMSGTAKAAYIFDAQQVGNNVVITGSGTLNLSGLSLSDSGGIGGEIRPYFSQLNIGSGNVDIYNGQISGHGIFNTSINQPFFSSIDIGVTVGFQLAGKRVYVPAGYVSGGVLGASESTFDHSTLAGLGLNSGRYTIELPNDTIQVDVGLSTVPLPSSAPMFGAALIGLAAVGYGLKRKRAAAADSHAQG